MIKPGISTEEINYHCHKMIISNHAVPAPLNYRGFPKSVCTSVNHVVCHGIPSKEKILNEGDIINVDVTVIVDGWHGDSSRMYCAGKINPKAKNPTNVRANANGMFYPKQTTLTKQPIKKGNTPTKYPRYCGEILSQSFFIKVCYSSSSRLIILKNDSSLLT